MTFGRQRAVAEGYVPQVEDLYTWNLTPKPCVDPLLDPYYYIPVWVRREGPGKVTGIWPKPELNRRASSYALKSEHFDERIIAKS